MPVYAFRHAPFEDLGNLRPALEARGFEVRTVDLYESGAAVPDLGRADALVFMGGPMCANDDLPFLHREADLIREATRIELPVLGICLGAQLIARALGGTVYKSAVPEIGWFQIEFTATGSSDPLFAGSASPQPVFQWHQDTFDLPPGAELLATAPACRHQAFRHGRAIYALQFHPEMTPEMIDDWQRHAALCGEPVGAIDPDLHAAELARFCDRIVLGWTEAFQ